MCVRFSLQILEIKFEAAHMAAVVRRAAVVRTAAVVRMVGVVRMVAVVVLE